VLRGGRRGREVDCGALDFGTKLWVELAETGDGGVDFGLRGGGDGYEGSGCQRGFGDAGAYAGRAADDEDVCVEELLGSTAAQTYLAFHHNAKLYKLSAVVSAMRPFSALEEANKLLFKQGTDDDFAVVAEKTIFHPQGGGQPSDEGVMTKGDDSVFRVSTVRMDAINDGQVLQFGRFDSSSANKFQGGDTVEQSIDVDKRLLYSRLHTAGHALGAAVRHFLEKEIPGFDELKASHFPDSASCEFQGSIEGK
ncbi:hypothetical protein N0V85_008962, partial [Neurospora sp. IMI 360204]